ncbi:MAG TPA: sulfatase-like hydrolase/transferase, partial [Planctomycetota bacterium]|nr:sulfatase-like hydrolase/transferase [Planctomycetota bacterium]
NVVLIVVDTLRADALRAEAPGTPGLDALADDALVFPRAFAHAPMTLPSHAALFSSRLPHATGVVNNGQAVPADLPLLSDWIARDGYVTRAVVSLGTLWGTAPGTSVDRGFDTYDTRGGLMPRAPTTQARLERVVDELDPARPFFLFAHFSDPHEPYNAHSGPERLADLVWNGAPLATVTTSDMTTWNGEVELLPGANRLEIAAPDEFFVRHLECRRAGRPLPWTFEEGALRRDGRRLVAVVRGGADETARVELDLWIHDVPDEAERLRRYREEVAFVDRAVAALVLRLRERGLLDESILVLTSDHGEALGERGSWGHVETLMDELLHVPLLVRLPPGHPAERRLRARTRDLVRHVDVVPTLLELLGLPPLPGQTGVSLLHDSERVLVAETHRPEATRDRICLRDGRYKLVHVPPDAATGAPEAFEMYDLREDPGELRDVYATRGGERREWEATLRALHAAYAASARGEAGDEVELGRLRALGYARD